MSDFKASRSSLRRRARPAAMPAPAWTRKPALNLSFCHRSGNRLHRRGGKAAGDGGRCWPGSG